MQRSFIRIHTYTHKGTHACIDSNNNNNNNIKKASNSSNKDSFDPCPMYQHEKISLYVPANIFWYGWEAAAYGPNKKSLTSPNAFTSLSMCVCMCALHGFSLKIMIKNTKQHMHRRQYFLLCFGRLTDTKCCWREKREGEKPKQKYKIKTMWTTGSYSCELYSMFPLWTIFFNAY